MDECIICDKLMDRYWINGKLCFNGCRNRCWQTSIVLQVLIPSDNKIIIKLLDEHYETS